MPRLLVALLAIAVAASVLGTGAAAAQVIPQTAPAPPVVSESPPDPDPSPHIRVLLARLAVLEARAALIAEQRSAAATDGDEQRARAALDGAERVQAAAERRVRTADEQLGSTAVSAYTHASGRGPGSDVPEEADVEGRQRELLAVSLAHHQRELVDAQAALARAEDAVDATLPVLAAAQQAAADQDGDVAVARRGLAEARGELRTATIAERDGWAWPPWDLSIVGSSAFTGDELAEWYDLQRLGGRASVPIADLAHLFVEEGEAEGIRGDMAFAQSIHETGWFANRDTIVANNFAGIGHCDACAAGIPFATAEVGVLAQIQLLKSYAEADPTYELPRADPSLNGPRGCCPAWKDLGGVWATDTGYGPRILGYYADMLEWLVAKRTAELATPP